MICISAKQSKNETQAVCIVLVIKPNTQYDAIFFKRRQAYRLLPKGETSVKRTLSLSEALQGSRGLHQLSEVLTDLANFSLLTFMWTKSSNNPFVFLLLGTSILSSMLSFPYLVQNLLYALRLCLEGSSSVLLNICSVPATIKWEGMSLGFP